MALDPTEDPGFIRWIFQSKPMCPNCGTHHTRNRGRHGRLEVRRCRSCMHRFRVPAIGYEADVGGVAVVRPYR